MSQQKFDAYLKAILEVNNKIPATGVLPMPTKEYMVFLS
jgi:hypothetical protein